MGFGGGGGSSSISGATDASVSNAIANNILVYSNLGKWSNLPLAGTVALPTGGGAETVVTNGSTSGATTLNLANGNVFNLTLSGATTFTFSGATAGKACAFSVYLTQDGTGSRTVTWPTVKWAGGTAPTLSTAANATDILVFESLNGGTTWFGSLVGANFS
jgi:hypothetical protein